MPFVKNIFLSTLITALIGFFPFITWASDYWLELIYGHTISLINAFVGYYLVLISIKKPDPEFYRNVYGGMLVRMVILFGLSIYIINSGYVLAAPYMLFLLLFYVIHQWVEISGWLKSIPIKRAQIESL